MGSNYQRFIDRFIRIPGGSLRSIGAERPARATNDAPGAHHLGATFRSAEVTGCTLEDRRATVGCYLVEEDGTVWCIYNRCEHGYAEVTMLYSPLMEQSETSTDQVLVEVRN